MKKNKNIKQFLRNFSCLLILRCMNTVGVFAQIKVSGSITDSNKDPLIGVNIKVSGEKTGTISDSNGKYTIQVPNATSALVFSYIGYKTVEKTVGTNTQINLSLDEETKNIDEVVVVAY